MKAFLYILTSLIFFYSCQNSPEVPVEQITIAEDIVLGMDIDSMYNFLKANGKKAQNFQVSGEVVGFYSSDVFDISDFRNTAVQLNHYGLFYPTLLTGTNRLLGLNVLLVSTHNSYNEYNTLSNIPAIKQEVNERLLKEVEDLLNKKYGQPSKTKTEYCQVYQIQGNQVKEYSQTPSECEILTWENDFLFVEFNKGFKSYETSFDPINICYNYWATIGGDPKEVDPRGDQIYSYSLPFIKYELKDTTVKILKLEKKLKI